MQVIKSTAYYIKSIALTMDISNEKTPELVNNQHVILGARQLSPARHLSKARRKLIFKVEARPPKNTTIKTLQNQ